MSGSRREVPLDRVLARTSAVLLIDEASLKSEEATASVPFDADGTEGAEGSFAFSFARQQAQVLEVLWEREPGGLEATRPVSFVSVSVQRSKYWNLRNERDGVRKIMYYDENPAFEQPRKGPTALLLLAGYDPHLGAHCAVMGSGLLPIRYRAQVLEAVQRQP